MRTRYLTLSTLASLALLAACDSNTGGAAGDSDENLVAAALLAPFTGVYDLQDAWNGTDGDEAFLLVETPGSDGTASVEFYDFDEFGNCLPTRPDDGTLRKDDFSNRIFLDDIVQLDEAELSLSGSTLTVEFNDDLDQNGDGSTQDRISITAEKLGVSQISDLGSAC